MSILYNVQAVERGRTVLYDYMEFDGIRWAADQDLSLQKEYLVELMVDLLKAARSMQMGDVMEAVVDAYWADVQSELEGE